MRRLCLALILGCVGLSAWADLPCASELTPAMRESLEAAARDDYTFEIMRKGTQTVVVFGEFHRKTPASAVLGRRVFEAYAHVAVEGYDETLYWGPRLRRRLETLWRKVVGARARVMDRPLGSRTEGSSIDDLLVEDIFSEDPLKLKAMSLLQLVLTAELWSKRKQAFVEKGRDRHDRGVRAQMVDRLLNQCRELVEARRRGVRPVAPPTPPRQIYPLEKGHRPTLAEQLRSLGLARGAAFLPPGLVFLTMLAVPDLQVPSVMWTAWIGSMYLAAQYGLDRVAWDKAWYQRLFPIGASVLVSRDRTMARNILEVMKSPHLDLLLAIVGRHHVPGLARRLEQAGFTRERRSE